MSLLEGSPPFFCSNRSFLHVCVCVCPLAEFQEWHSWGVQDTRDSTSYLHKGKAV
jgi:hypothetical protein